MLVYQEFHGDLHPGNLLLNGRPDLYFIDWGNSVDLGDIWRPALNYLQAVLAGDAHAITGAMIALGSEPAELHAQRGEILRLVEQTLAEVGVTPLGRDFALVLYREGAEGLLQRLELAMGLATVMARHSIVINSDYMHLTRSITAMLGSYLGIYRGVSRLALVQDAVQVVMQFPALEGYRQMRGYRRRLLRQVAADLPVGRTLAGAVA